jgi:hypothetical protein
MIKALSKQKGIPKAEIVGRGKNFTKIAYFVPSLDLNNIDLRV